MPTAGVAGEPGPTCVLAFPSVIGTSRTAGIADVAAGGGWAGGDGPRLWAGRGRGRLSVLLP